MLFATKRLSAVEIGNREDPKSSHQHEFNAGRVRSELGFGLQEARGRLRLLFYRDNNLACESDSCSFVLYNAREGKPRAAEYRLYYTSKKVGAHALEGDLFVLFRPDPKSHDLVGVIARSGTTYESALLSSLRVDPKSALKRFVISEPGLLPTHAVATLFFGSTTAAPPEHPLLQKALSSGRIPAAREIQTAVADDISTALDPDSFISQSLAAESRLYFTLEEAVKGRELRFLITTEKATLHNVLKFALSIQQSRKARRGDSLQFHFERLLKSRKIPFSRQATTEHGETPDVLVPGQKQYRDATFPADLLRMVACKSTVRERWSQVAREAKRIEEKYLLTLDHAITADTIRNMTENHRIFPFIPADVKAKHYASISSIRTVAELVSLLDGVVDLAVSKKKLKRPD